MGIRVALVAVLALIGPVVGGSPAAGAPATPRAPLAPALARPVFTGQPVGDPSIPVLHSLLPAGDLQGNGKRDVLDIRQTTEEGQSGTVGVTARHGATGTAIWAHHYSVGPLEFLRFIPERVGPDAVPGVLVVDSAEDLSSGGPTTPQTLKLTALDGVTGKKIWSKTMQGVSSSGGDSEVPDFIGAIPDGAHGASSLITLESSTSTQFTVVPELISGVDGTPAPFSGSETTSVDDGEASYQVIGDLNGDGTSDVILQVPGSNGFVRVFSGATDASLVTVSGLPQEAFNQVQTVGKITGAPVPNLAFDVYDQVSNEDQVYLVSGVTGDVVWSRPAAAFSVIGKAGSPRVPVLGLYNAMTTGDTTTIGESATFEAVNGTDGVVYRKTVSDSLAIPAHFSGAAGATPFDVGDVQPDGATEFGIDLDVAVMHGTTTRDKHVTGIVDGATGRFHAVAAQTGSDGSLVHGSGADLLAVGLSKHKLVVTGWNGTNRHRFYRRTIAGVGTWSEAAVGGLRVTGHACSDISLTTETLKHGGLTVLSGSGVALWTLSFANTAATGGTLKHFSKPKHFCA